MEAACSIMVGCQAQSASEAREARLFIDGEEIDPFTVGRE